MRRTRASMGTVPNGRQGTGGPARSGAGGQERGGEDWWHDLRLIRALMSPATTGSSHGRHRAARGRRADRRGPVRVIAVFLTVLLGCFAIGLLLSR